MIVALAFLEHQTSLSKYYLSKFEKKFKIFSKFPKIFVIHDNVQNVQNFKIKFNFLKSPKIFKFSNIF